MCDYAKCLFKTLSDTQLALNQERQYLEKKRN